MHAHKITLQSLWQPLMPIVLEFCLKLYPDLFQEISDLACSPKNSVALVISLKSPRMKKMLDKFVAERSKENASNFKFWGNYMEMVSILLMFTRAQREGMGPVLARSSPNAAIFFQILPSESCKLGISVYGRGGAVAQGGLRRVQKGKLCC